MAVPLIGLGLDSGLRQSEALAIFRTMVLALIWLCILSHLRIFVSQSMTWMAEDRDENNQRS